MLRYFLLLSLVLPLSGYGQTYADLPFYQPVSAIPSTAHVDGYAHGSMHANGVIIDLSEWVPASSPDFDRIAGWSEGADVDGNKPAQRFHFYIQHDHMNPAVVFGYDLLAEPVAGTDEIRCTFSALTDSATQRQRSKEIAPVALPADLTPVVIHSGDVLAIRMLPLGPGRIADIHYLRLIRADQTPTSAQ
jgi:hypothetical protein